jgi:hypothetical protein
VAIESLAFMLIVTAIAITGYALNIRLIPLLCLVVFLLASVPLMLEYGTSYYVPLFFMLITGAVAIQGLRRA